MYLKFFKRFFDVLLSLICLPFLLILVMIIAPIIIVDDGFPIFYKARRRGKGCVGYNMIKFRSMKNNSPDIRTADNETFNSKNDPRLTKVGRVLRELSIDEIPQFFNVLVGDMSLIGPRPCIDDKSKKELDDIEQKIVSVKPGITGYNQVYFRNSVSKNEKFINDAYYVDHLSFSLDVKIFFKTIESVFCKKNIYTSKEH